MKPLRILLAGLAATFACALPALAQSNVSIFQSTTPVQKGDHVQGMVLYPNGTMGIGQVEVTGYWADDMTTYWRGSYLGGTYVYDTYSGFWKPTPVVYENSTLQFQDQQLEGWVRYFGGKIDRNLFMGRDGDVYKRVNITKKQRRGKRSRTRIMYTYFLDLRTLERSDGRFVPYYGISEADQEYIKQQAELQDAALAAQAAENPAFPQWNGENGQPAEEVVTVPSQPTADQQQSVADLIEEQVGPVQGPSPQPQG